MGIHSLSYVKLTRRGFLTVPALAAFTPKARPQTSETRTSDSWKQRFQQALSSLTDPTGARIPANDLRVTKRWSGNVCNAALENRTTQPIRVGEAVLFTVRHGLDAGTPLYAEGFQMLTQTAGTIAQPEPLSQYTDPKHYRLPEPAGAFTAYNMLLLEPASAPVLFGYTSCKRFTGKIHVRAETLEFVFDLEGLEIAPGARVDLDEFAFFDRGARDQLLTDFAARIALNHPPILRQPVPQGWCSWYCFGPKVTAPQVMENLDFIAKSVPALRYIQIDDGYQPAMGDWLETGKGFGGAGGQPIAVQTVLKQIRERGFEPAIWVAPFIAEKESKVFQAHPDWFMKDAAGAPLSADKVTFQGWRRGPWYALDGTHPEARAHLENVFRTMRNEWGVTYFKLDANFWGAMPGGRLHDPQATRVEAYRRGMEAIRRGAGDAFLLGCNHPLWPSLGLIHGSRSSGDISRSWARFRDTARQNLQRSWQNGRLWWNDPDVLELAGKLSEDEFHFHAAAIYASGGMLLSGDDLPRLPAAKLEMLRKLSPPTGVAAAFDDRELNVGRMSTNGRTLLFLFNWSEQAATRAASVSPGLKVTDFWTGDPVKVVDGAVKIDAMPTHSARILVLG